VRKWLKVAVVAAVLTVALAGVLVGGGGYTPPDPALCDDLRAQSESTPDVAYAMEERGCPDPPYERLAPTTAPVLGRAGDRGGSHG
jgi:hypothetical protein